MDSSELMSKLLASNSQGNNNINNNQQLQQQLYSLFSGNNNGTRNGNSQQILPINDIIKNLSILFEQFFGSKFFIISVIAIVFTFLLLCSFCFMLYCCCHSKWCRKLHKKETKNKFKMFN